MNDHLKAILKPEFRNSEALTAAKDIAVLPGEHFIHGDNQKYRKMYDWMSYGYDLAETVIGKLKYGNSIDQMRAEIMSKLEWKNDISVLYVSIGTGKNLQFIPSFVNKKTLEITGIDISLGMLKRCWKKFGKKLNLSLINCCAEDLPFNDNMFDLVFHVGGINFFNDKNLAIREMIRVAKPGTGILISDETNYFIQQQFKTSKLSKRYFEGKSFDLSELQSQIPGHVRENKTELIWENRCYCITFRK